MTVLKLHYDGWLKLPASLQRALRAAAGDPLEVVAAEGGLVLRIASAAPASPGAETASPTAAAPAMPASLPAAEPPTPAKRGRTKKAVADTSAVKTPRPVSVILPPTLRAAGRRKSRAVQPPA
jgi:hypothetical protein